MKKPKALPDYDDLPFLPYMLANTVANRPYTGQEWAFGIVSPEEVADIEALRQKMTVDDIARFETEVEDRCRKAHKNKARFWVNVINASGNKGRDQLYIWITHWLTGFLKRTPAVPKQTA